MKCIVIETSPERTNANPVTNEDGTPHVYATISEARAELKANGYSYNRENQRYYIKGTEYRAYILRADSEEYAKINAPYLIWEDDPETMTPENYAAEDAAYSLINAYADAIGEYPAETDPEYMAAFAVAGEEIAGWHGVADIHDRATVAQMVEAIADRARDAAADPEDLEEPAPIYQRHELLAYLGEPDAYDVEAIEAEATRYTADGARVWSAFGEDLAAIAERHELVTYAPAI